MFCWLLDAAQVVVRGPKPTTALHSRKVRIDRAAGDPFTTHEVLATVHGTPLCGKRIVVQRYGETNRELQAALESEGADVIEIATYRWGLPEDTTPLLRLIDALDRDEIDLVAFTSASQASNLFAVAQCDGKEASLKQSLGRTLVASRRAVLGQIRCNLQLTDEREHVRRQTRMEKHRGVDFFGRRMSFGLVKNDRQCVKADLENREGGLIPSLADHDR